MTTIHPLPPDQRHRLAALLETYAGEMRDTLAGSRPAPGAQAAALLAADPRTEILVASVRHPIHVLESAKIGADVATMPPAVIKSLFKHVLTDKGIEGFLADWAKTGQKIG